jgi:anti-sigma regulatory factor (Ser/Thr protein kinase)
MANICLRISNRPECVAVAHGAVLGLASALALDALTTDALDTAVGEAVKNAVLHAYEGAAGPVELELQARAGELEAVVRDRGIGIRPHLGERTQPHTGIGLPVVHLLARRVVYTNMPGGGTEIRIELPSEGLVAPGGSESSFASPCPERLGDHVELALAPAAIARAALPRVLAALLAAAGLPRDARAAIATAAAALEVDRPLGLEGALAEGSVELRLGPLAPDAGAGLLRAWRERLTPPGAAAQAQADAGETLALSWSGEGAR